MRKLILIQFLFNSVLQAQELPIILDERSRAEVVNEVLEDRFNNLLPGLMRREGFDMWILISREYHEDPVMKTMLPAEWINARRRTVMVFYDNGKAIEQLAIARYDVGLLKSSWNINVYPNQWDALIETIKTKNPKKIGIDFSANYAHADGLSHYEYDQFMTRIPTEFLPKIQSAEKLAVSWLETRTKKEMILYEHIARISHLILRQGFSNQVIQPGVTTTDDVVWWYRQRITSLGLDTWFHPTVDIQKADTNRFDHLRTFSKRPELEIIQPGDLLHVDFGITYLRLNSDMQEHAYVLKPDETEVPEYLQKGFAQANRLQDILTESFNSGKSGNDILSSALTQASKEGINGSIYTHPIGYHGHAAGPTIGMWDNQGKTLGPGDYPLHAQTAFSIELNASVAIPEWNNKMIRFMLEQDGYYDGKTFRYIDGRQTKIYAIQR
ncbi:MAG: M24 family metallopeptidase [Saprospiraceae bacterium]